MTEHQTYCNLTPVVVSNEPPSEDGAGDPLAACGIYHDDDYENVEHVLSTEDIQYVQQLLGEGDTTSMAFQHDEVSLLSAPLINSNSEAKQKKEGSKPEPKQCNNCGKFVLHLSKHKNACFKKKPYVCEICGSRFSQKSNLNRHVSSKHGNNPVTCQYCNRKMKRRDKMKTHIEKSHIFDKQE